jgi:hypothetical protein
MKTALKICFWLLKLPGQLLTKIFTRQCPVCGSPIHIIYPYSSHGPTITICLNPDCDWQVETRQKKEEKK